ncbi:MAG: M48 family metallopeptidase [Bacilli bacterium]|nr:M48 family metallopeptidase [Bacilli bacterium]MDD4733713.1 M48 family metallopeptidase [Bacilli bacterium]
MILRDVKRNKNKTYFIAFLFFVFLAAFIFAISLFFAEATSFTVVIAVVISLIVSVGSYYNSDKIILSLNKARVATKEEYAQLNNILEGLCLATGLPMPKLYIMEDSAMNAFATGRNPENAVICLTTGLIERLDKNEVEAVIAHELSHIKNYDILLQTVAIVMVGAVVIVSDIFSRSIYRSSDDRDSDNKFGAIIAIISLIFIILAPIFGELLKLLLSRNREYLADSSAVEITRNKEGLISALKKISGDSEVLEQAHKSSESLFIVSPLKEHRTKPNSIWSTHPNLENRIKAISDIQ